MDPAKDRDIRRSAEKRRSAWGLLLLCAIVVAGCSGMRDTAGGAYDFLESSRPEAAERLQVPLADGFVPVELAFPRGYNTSRRWPVCLVLQRAGESLPLPPDMRRAAAERGFILALAELPATAGSEDSAEVLPFVDSLLDSLRKNYASNPKRITLYGRGPDADLAARIACARSHRIAGLALVDGGRAPAGCRPVKPIPAIVIATSPDAAGGVASFWAHNNGCEPMPTSLLTDGVVRERYQCPLPQSAVQRYLVQGAVEGETPLDSFTAAWTMFEFLWRQSDF